MLIVIGDTTITTGLIRRAKKFGFAICFMSYGFKLYSVICNGMEGNTYLHEKQYGYSGNFLAVHIIKNKISNQRNVLQGIRKKTEDVKEAIEKLRQFEASLDDYDISTSQIMAIEGNAAKVYFARIFNNVNWKGRKPRIKFDYVNSLLDIGYTLLFNFIDSILQVFGFDVYRGVMHTCFYMRKSLVCDLMEPFRSIIDWRVRIGINLGQFKCDDFIKDHNNQWQLEYQKSAEYTSIFLTDILENKEQIFLYIRGFYRAFMKEGPVSSYPVFDIKNRAVTIPYEE